MSSHRAAATTEAALARRAEAHAARGDNHSARLAAERAARTKDSASACVLLARLTWKSDLRGALARLDRALALEPGSGFARCFRGELLRRSGRPALGLAELDRGLALLPGEPRARVWRAKTLLTLGRRAEARAELERALELAPRRARTRAAYGYALELSGDADGAEKEYGLALRGERSGPRDMAEAVEAAESREEMLGWLLFRRFVARAKAGRLAAALKDLDAAHALDPKHVWDGGDGPPPDALASFVMARPRDARLLAWAGHALTQRGEFAAAEAALDRALALGDRSGRTYAWRALARLRLGRDEEARADARAAAARDGRYPPLLGVLCELELRRKRFPAAERQARRALRVYPHAAWAYRLLGESLLGRGRAREARAALDRALAWSPGDPSARRLRAEAAR